ncbi:MAG: hypothetical protein V3V15_08500 [Sphingorhabdus sp.]
MRHHNSRHAGLDPVSSLPSAVQIISREGAEDFRGVRGMRRCTYQSVSGSGQLAEVPP